MHLYLGETRLVEMFTGEGGISQSFQEIEKGKIFYKIGIFNGMSRYSQILYDN